MIVNKLISSYAKLPTFEKSILQILSIVYIPLNQTQLKHCLIQTGVKAADGIGFDSVSRNEGFKQMRPALDALLEQHLLEGKSRSRLLVDRRIIEIITRQTITAKKYKHYLKVIPAILNLTEESLGTYASHLEIDHLVAAIRILFYQKKTDQIKSLYRKHKDKPKHILSLAAILKQISCNPFDTAWVLTLPADIHTDLFQNPLIDDLRYWQNKAEHSDYIEQLVLSDSDRCEASLQALVLEKWLLAGKSQKIENWMKKNRTDDTENSLCLKAWMAFLQGKNEKAIQYYEAAFEVLKKNSAKRKIYFDNFMGVFFVLALMKANSAQRLKQARAHLSVAISGTYQFSDIYRLLDYPLQFLTGNSKAATKVFSHTYVSIYSWEQTDFIKLFFLIFTYYWIDKDKAKEKLSTIKKLYNSAEINAYPWFKNELAGLLNILSGNGKKTAYKPESKCLITVVKPTNVWEHTLNALLALKDKSRTKTEPNDNDFRMVWFLDYRDSGFCGVRPREQKRRPDGSWTKGRPIALKRLLNELENFSYLTQQDKQICSYIYAHEYQDGWYTNVEYIFNDKYLSAVIGHPLIFLPDGTSRVELVKGKPELRITQQKNKQIFLELFPKPLQHEEDYRAVKETETRIKLVSIDDEYQRIAAILGKGIRVPASAKSKLRKIIEKFASDITIHSDIEGKSEQLTEVEADAKINMHLTPFGNGLKIALFVRPFGIGGAYYSPGAGGRNVIAEINGKRLQTTRDLAQEKLKSAELIDNCPTLQHYEENLGEWLIDEIGDCLEFLSELDDLRQLIVLEWPEGEKFKLAGQASLSQFRMSIKRQKDWFAATGNLHIDKQTVIDMQQLLALTEKSQSRFIELKDGQFIALTDEFRKRLQELGRYSEKYGKGVRFHPLAALALEGLTDSVGQLKTDAAWKSHVKKLQSAQDHSPQLPSTLQAELRDYQVEGFSWLALLSQWGVGACLADDMGLGKTMQAMAMLLKHAPDGPSLVVAPTSVCMNWEAEAIRFAPTLNMIRFGGANRDKILETADKFDVILCSYGLLQQSRAGEMLAAVSWQMVVLDEAQAIKNFFTKRSKAAMKLQGKFKLITTGTPIENHLGELWNLFQFINPGLLSSMESFNKNYAVPIEKYKDRQSRRHLQKLILPFILRRTKSQVLEELPARTEVRLTVELSKEEMAFYEALRQRAVEQLSESKENSGGKKYLKILAEIMKLRRACCNSTLVNEEFVLPSSKLAMFGNVLQELLENKHKALVFSQFVGHLNLIRAYLDEHNIHYQYLDGSTPVKQRKIAVDSFQAGEGDVFLISLKAGGLGLNLTAADYVIHMDPWWNPAVEDQASDRAHRIGQQRPVTIYRLVAKDTIEEKIVEMHSHKRDLADSLLQGSDMSGKISSEELLELITD